MAALAYPSPYVTDIDGQHPSEPAYQPPQPMTTQQIESFNANLYRPYLNQLSYSIPDQKKDHCAIEAYPEWQGMSVLREHGGPISAVFEDFLSQLNIQICMGNEDNPPQPLSEQHRIITIPGDYYDFHEEMDLIFHNIFHAIQEDALKSDITSIAQLENYILLQNTGLAMMFSIAHELEKNGEPDYWNHLSETQHSLSTRYFLNLNDQDISSIDYRAGLEAFKEQIISSKFFDHQDAFDNFYDNDFKQNIAAAEHEPNIIESYLFDERDQNHIEDRGLISASKIIRDYMRSDYKRKLYSEWKHDYLDYQAIFAAKANKTAPYSEKLLEIVTRSKAYTNMRPDHIAHKMEETGPQKEVQSNFSEAAQHIYDTYHKGKRYLLRRNQAEQQKYGCTNPSQTITEQTASEKSAKLSHIFNLMFQKKGLVADITNAYMQQPSLLFCIEGEEELGKGVSGSYSHRQGIISFNEETKADWDYEDTLVHEMLHQVQDRNGLMYFDDNIDIYGQQTLLLSIEAAARSIGTLYYFEQSLHGDLHEETRNHIMSTNMAPIYTAIQESYDIDKEHGTPHKEALRIAGEAGFYAFAQRPKMVGFYNRRVATSFMRRITQNEVRYPMQSNADLTEQISKSGAYADDLNITADVTQETVPDFFGQDQDMRDLFAYLNHYAETIEGKNRNIPHKPKLDGNPYSGIDIINFYKKFTDEHDADPYFIMDEINKIRDQQGQAAPLEKKALPQAKTTL